jgi:flagellar biosynthesis/type III secretory pathway M-ring protein FliF/YscJ
MSLAVLVDQEVTWEPDKNGPKRLLVPPSPEKLKVIRDLVAGITGFTAERGDQLVIDTLPFESTLLLEPPPQPPLPAAPSPPATPLASLLKLDRKMRLIAGGAAGAVLLLVVVIVLLFRRRPKKARSADITGPAAVPAGEGTAQGTLGAPVEQQMESKLAERDALQLKADAQALNAFKVAPVITKASEVLSKHIREKVSKESEMSAQILRTWIREEEEG